MQNLKSNQIKYLSSKAQTLKPVVYLGKEGINEPLIKSLDQALDDHELVKVKFVNYKEEKRELAPQLAESTGSVLVRIIGNVALFYRQSNIIEKQKLVLPE